jgi:hypothetical protein
MKGAPMRRRSRLVNPEVWPSYVQRYQALLDQQINPIDAGRS